MYIQMIEKNLIDILIMNTERALACKSVTKALPNLQPSSHQKNTQTSINIQYNHIYKNCKL